MNDTLAVILAGGRGKRLKPITDEIPKPLISLAGKPLIDHALDVVRAAGIDSTIVVGGYKVDMLREHLTSVDPTIITLEADWRMQNLDGFALSLPYIEEKNVFVLNADYVFSEENIVKTVRGMNNDLVAFCSYDLSGDDEDVMTVHEEGGRIVAMSKTLTEFESVYTGMLYIPARLVRRVTGMVEELLENVDRTAVSVERILLELSSEGEDVKVVDVGASNWTEVDTIEELEVARCKFGE